MSGPLVRMPSPVNIAAEEGRPENPNQGASALKNRRFLDTPGYREKCKLTDTVPCFMVPHHLTQGPPWNIAAPYTLS
jgi:hypothetical protein